MKITMVNSSLREVKSAGNPIWHEDQITHVSKRSHFQWRPNMIHALCILWYARAWVRWASQCYSNSYTTLGINLWWTIYPRKYMLRVLYIQEIAWCVSAKIIPNQNQNNGFARQLWNISSERHNQNITDITDKWVLAVRPYQEDDIDTLFRRQCKQ